MQAIGFLSRREYSRQELRAKLLDSLRKRAREDAALAAAAEAAERELAQALAEQPSNGIDDAFAPRAPVASPSASRRACASGRGPARVTRESARAGAYACAHGDAAASSPADTRAALATLTRGDGGALSPRLKARLEAVAAEDAPAVVGTVRVSTGDGDLDDFAIDIGDDAFGIGDSPAPATGAPGAPLEQSDPEAAVDQLLDWLIANKYLNETRFVESRVNARSRKQGTLRIKLELSRHGLTLEPEQVAALRETEFARAKALWDRKFGTVATEARERAKQARFLAARGFAAGVVRRVVGGEEEF